VEFYRNRSEKNDISVYAKALLSLNKFELFADLQYRFVNYKGIPVAGGENEFEDFFPFEGEFNFLNPKLGLSFYASPQDVLYFYYGMAHREPHRGDYLDNPEPPTPEKLHDFELGYKKSGRLNLNANGFFMYYIDQLVATGELNDVGEYKRTNSGKSYRTGIELSAAYDILPQKLNVFGNLTYSLNQNLDYSEITYDDDWNEILVQYGDTNISFSPNWIGALGVQFIPTKTLTINLQNKYVGEQFLTNTELEDGKLDAYFLTDLLFQFAPKWFGLKNLEFSFLINNLLDQEYESNGYYYEGTYYYPQAGINFLGGFKFRL